MMFNPKWIVGKTVERVDMGIFPAGHHHTKGAGVAHDPRIWFTDGSSIAFVTEETEVGAYGTDIIYSKGSK